MVLGLKAPTGLQNIPAEQTFQSKMHVSQTAFLNEDMEWIVEKGRIRLMAGSSSTDIRCSREISIISDKIIDERNRGFYASCKEETW